MSCNCSSNSTTGLGNLIQNTLSIGREIQKSILPNSNCDQVCPPKQTCPPDCLAIIHRSARVGERILISFQIKNEHHTTKTYRVGIRPLTNNQGQIATPQPQLSTNMVTLDPLRSHRVTMVIDLLNYTAGDYQTEIVIREDKYNQNICFTLCVKEECDVAVVKPWDEGDIKPQWLGWKRHFMCPKPEGQQTSDDPTPNDQPNGGSPNTAQNPSVKTNTINFEPIS